MLDKKSHYLLCAVISFLSFSFYVYAVFLCLDWMLCIGNGYGFDIKADSLNSLKFYSFGLKEVVGRLEKLMGNWSLRIEIVSIQVILLKNLEDKCCENFN